MKADDKRNAKRKVVLKPARASDATGTIMVNCIVRDASTTGCMIVSSQVGELPEEILLDVDGIKGARKGIIAWRRPMTAGVQIRLIPAPISRIV